MASIDCPKKTREYVDDLMDSTVWNDFKFRSGDVIIATYSKAGTTWMQQIVAQLIFNGEDAPVGELSPWVEFKLHTKEETLAGLERQTNRRFLKTHLPIDALAFSSIAKYIYVVRDGRDIAFSFHHFVSGFSERPPGMTPPNPDLRQYFNDWLDKDGCPFHPFFSHVQGWWNVRHLPNVLLVHFDNLKADMVKEMGRVARFLDIPVDEATWPRMVEHCTFDYMKGKADEIAPVGARMLKGGMKVFFRSGKNGSWRDVLTPADSAKYDRFVATKLTPDCAHWLRTGELPE